jgi:proteasome lid subunit RPN8/RPN11
MAGFTNLRMTRKLYRKLYDLAYKSYPNEVFALIAGYFENGWNYATNIVKVKIRNSSPFHVNFSVSEIIQVLNRYHIIGEYHSHPQDEHNYNSTRPSEADMIFASKLEKKLRKPIYMLILSMPSGILSCWFRGEHVNFEIVEGFK